MQPEPAVQMTALQIMNAIQKRVNALNPVHASLKKGKKKHAPLQAHGMMKPAHASNLLRVAETPNVPQKISYFAQEAAPRVRIGAGHIPKLSSQLIHISSQNAFVHAELRRFGSQAGAFSLGITLVMDL